MLKQTIALAVLAFAAASPVMADATTPLNALGGLSRFGRDATRVYVLRTARPMLPVLNRFQFGREVVGSPTQAFPPLPGLTGASFGPVIQGGISTFKVSVPLTKSSTILPSTGLGIKTTKITTSGGSGLGGGAGAASQFIGTFTALPKTGAVVIASTAGSLTTLPKTGAAILASTSR